MPKAYSVEEFIRAFWARVNKATPSGCWLWTGPKDRKGYGMVKRQGKQIRAHRLSYELSVGPIPDGLFALHKCDVRDCVNPAHLFLGTNTDNMRDCAAKGRTYYQRHPERAARGERCNKAKLTEAQAIDIIRRLRAGAGCAELGREYGVTKMAISQIKRGVNWRHLQGGHHAAA